ncbi:unnamed protein product, partial [Phaeothamnion confervicola]
LHQNLGVTGPRDGTNRNILTHAFVHCTHLEVFGGRFFPRSFRNWWSDDWISAVYGEAHTFRDHRETVVHKVGAQKLRGATTRYSVDEAAEGRLEAELKRGFVRLSTWMAVQRLPPPCAPDVCGYTPLAGEL